MPTNDQRLDWPELTQRQDHRITLHTLYASNICPLTNYPTSWYPFRNILNKLCSKGKIGNNRAFFDTLSELGNTYLKETRLAEKNHTPVSLDEQSDIPLMRLFYAYVDTKQWVSRESLDSHAARWQHSSLPDHNTHCTDHTTHCVDDTCERCPLLK